MILDPSAVRERSWRMVQSVGLAHNPSLPLLVVPDSSRQVEEVATRALCLHAIVASAFRFPRGEVQAWLAREGIQHALVPSELRFLNGDDSELLIKQHEVHSLFMLMWALQFVNVSSIWDRVPANLVGLLPDINRSEVSSGFRRRSVLRSRAALLDMADQAYCFHWALQDAYLRRLPAARNADLPVVRSRRKALEWLMSEREWDLVVADT